MFQIGSITKVWTATVVMQLVDEGLLDLDTPVVEVLPELRLADPDVTKSVTMRHLLTHTSGIDGDVFTDTGRGDDCLEKYVDAARPTRRRTTRSARPGPTATPASRSLGRVIEKLTGSTWDAAMRERLFTPARARRTPARCPRRRCCTRAAVGHVEVERRAACPRPAWGLPRSVGPAGLITSTVADVLAFARAAPDRRPRRRRHARAAQRGERRRDDRARRPTCRTSTSSATRGASAGSASAGTVSG